MKKISTVTTKFSKHEFLVSGVPSVVDTLIQLWFKTMRVIVRGTDVHSLGTPLQMVISPAVLFKD